MARSLMDGSVIPLACGFVVAASLAHAGLDRLTHRVTYLKAIQHHAVWSPRLLPFLVAVQGLLELALGTAGLMTLLGFSVLARFTRGLFLISALIFLAYGAYGLFLLLRRPGIPCACDRSDLPASVWTIARAVTLSAGAAATSSFPPVGAWAALSGSEDVMVVGLSLSLAIILWGTPAALADPWALTVPVTTRDGT
jgi:hypothetical protein